MLCAECVQYFNYSYHSVGYVAQETYRDMFVECNNKDLLGVYAGGSVTFKNEERRYTNAFNNVLNDASLGSLDDEFVIGSNALAALSNAVDLNKSIDLHYTFFDGIVDLSYQVSLNSVKYKGAVSLHIGACEYAQNVDDEQIDDFKKFINSTIGEEQDKDTRQILRTLA